MGLLLTEKEGPGAIDGRVSVGGHRGALASAESVLAPEPVGGSIDKVDADAGVVTVEPNADVDDPGVVHEVGTVAATPNVRTAVLAPVPAQLTLGGVSIIEGGIGHMDGTGTPRVVSIARSPPPNLLLLALSLETQFPL